MSACSLDFKLHTCSMLITPNVFVKAEILCCTVDQPVKYVCLGAGMRSKSLISCTGHCGVQ